MGPPQKKFLAPSLNKDIRKLGDFAGGEKKINFPFFSKFLQVMLKKNGIFQKKL